APMPSSSGISTSIVTRSGLSECTLLSASRPLRAVPTTRKPPAPSTISATSLRMNALSSTTSTVRGALEDDIALHHGADLHLAGLDVKEHAAPVSAPDVLADDGQPRLA